MTTRAQNCIAVTISALLIASAAHAAGGLTASAVKNLKVHVPSMGQGPGDWIQFKNGDGIKNKTVGWAKMKSVAVGSAGNVPFAVSHVTWHGTSGSGYWNTLVLFKELKGKTSQTGIFTSYVSSADKVEIRRGRIFVHLTDAEEVPCHKDMGSRVEGNGWVSLAPSAFTP